jgi:drug/metabolite transporter (DMT)-like permease
MSRPVCLRPSNPQYDSVNSRRSRSPTGHPFRHETPVIRVACAASIRSIVPRNADAAGGTVALGDPPAARVVAATYTPIAVDASLTSRGGRIRTGDLSLPKRALYQAELRPESAQCRWIACGLMVDAPTLLPEGRPDDKTRLGYAMVATAAALFAVNGSVSKVVLSSGLSSLELAQIRNTCAAILFLAFLLVVAPSRLRVGRRELVFLIAFGLVGIALVQWLYFVAIENLPVGVALLIEFTAPLFVALFARFVYKEHVRRRIWVAVAMCLTGLALVVELWTGVAFSTVGVTAAFGGALALTAYLLMAERQRRHRDAASLSFYGFLFAALLWAVIQPLWEFPWNVLGDDVSLQGNLSEYSAPVWALVAFIVVIGTMITFSLLTGSLRHISATRASIVATLEPVVATIVAWAWLGETFGPTQLIGGAVVIAGILVAQSAR